MTDWPARMATITQLVVVSAAVAVLWHEYQPHDRIDPYKVVAAWFLLVAVGLYYRLLTRPSNELHEK